MRVLVVEDARDMNRLIVKVLKKSGYSVDGCFNGEEALEFLGGAEYDAVLLDVMMPKMDGYSLLKQLRDQGKIGFKTGEGFQKWTPEQAAASNAALNEYLIRMLYGK